MSEPTTEAGKRLLFQFVSRDGNGEPVIERGSDIVPHIAAIEAEARTAVLRAVRADLRALWLDPDEGGSHPVVEWLASEFWVDGEPYVRWADIEAAIDRRLEAADA